MAGLPVLSWVQVEIGHVMRGRVTGTWTACFFFGQFAGPALLVGVGCATGGLTNAAALLGAFALVVGAIVTHRSRY